MPRLDIFQYAFEPAVLIAWVIMTVPISVMGLYLGYKKLAPLWAINVWLLTVQLSMYPQLETLLSFPKPGAFEFFPPARVEVISAVIQPGHAIYIWVLDPRHDAPRAFRITYTDKRAKGLRDALAKQARKGERVFFEPSLNEHKQFYNPPPKGIPPKMRIQEQ